MDLRMKLEPFVAAFGVVAGSVLLILGRHASSPGELRIVGSVLLLSSFLYFFPESVNRIWRLRFWK